MHFGEYYLHWKGIKLERKDGTKIIRSLNGKFGLHRCLRVMGSPPFPCPLLFPRESTMRFFGMPFQGKMKKYITHVCVSSSVFKSVR